MKYELTQEDMQLLARIEARMNPSQMMHAVYIPPAQQLRNRANEIEAEERDGQLFRELLQRIRLANQPQ